MVGTRDSMARETWWGPTGARPRVGGCPIFAAPPPPSDPKDYRWYILLYLGVVAYTSKSRVDPKAATGVACTVGEQYPFRFLLGDVIGTVGAALVIVRGRHVRV